MPGNDIGLGEPIITVLPNRLKPGVTTASHRKAGGQDRPPRSVLVITPVSLGLAADLDDEESWARSECLDMAIGSAPPPLGVGVTPDRLTKDRRGLGRRKIVSPSPTPGLPRTAARPAFQPAPRTRFFARRFGLFRSFTWQLGQK
jgi:hypothetical protein